MRRRRNNPWLGIGMDAWSLGFEASTVIGLRVMKIAQGGAAAEAETQRMVQEKLQAVAQLQMQAMTGGLGFTPATASGRTITHLRRKVRANRRRLSKS
jgi:hypothetical protein